MPGRYFLTQPLAPIAEAFGVTLEAPDPGPRLDAAPGEEVAIMLPGRMTTARWGMVMSGRVNARGRPVMETIVNARSETVFSKSAFAGVQRAVLPVGGWYEWTGTRGRKTRWQISAREDQVLLFAAIYDVWHGPGGVEVGQMATVTCEPNGDVAEYHHRMPVLLNPSDLTLWLEGDEAPAKDLMVPAAEGLLKVEKSTLK
ncbi:MAG: SOS response-associated peptidase family protein [Pseudomonadota bacterium]